MVAVRKEKKIGNDYCFRILEDKSVSRFFTFFKKKVKSSQTYRRQGRPWGSAPSSRGSLPRFAVKCVGRVFSDYILNIFYDFDRLLGLKMSKTVCWPRSASSCKEGSIVGPLLATH